MKDTDYKTILDRALTELGFAIQRRDAAEVEISKQRQFIAATLNMLSDDERKHFRERLIEAFQQNETRFTGLTDAIRKILQTGERKWRTVAEVRTLLSNSGFDFSSYTANPLASISTTLKRMAPNEVETTTIETVTAYRWKGSRMASAFARANKRTLTERIQDFEDSIKRKK